MNKTELIAAIALKAKTTKVVATEMLSALLETITQELKSGGQIVIPGHFTLQVSKREARMGRNPRTGQQMKIAASNVVRFKAGKQLKDSVQ